MTEIKTTVKKLVKFAAPALFLGVHNTVYNWRYVTAGKRFLVVRHPRKTGKYNIILDWENTLDFFYVEKIH